jgi:hypothetical protein
MISEANKYTLVLISNITTISTNNYKVLHMYAIIIIKDYNNYKVTVI